MALAPIQRQLQQPISSTQFTGQPVGQGVPFNPAGNPLQTLQQAPPTGLIGSEQALRAGLTGSLQGLETGFGQARQDLLGALGGGGGVSSAPDNIKHVPLVVRAR